MNLWHSLAGVIHVKVSSADVPRTLSVLERNQISIQNVAYLDYIHISFTVKKRDYLRVQQILTQKGDEICQYRSEGTYFSLYQLSKRPILVLTTILILLLTLWLPNRVLFIRVEGNEQLSEKQILEEAKSCGIIFGASRKIVRSEHVKNVLMERLEQLQWAGINTYGCNAVITVKERTDYAPQAKQIGISNIVAVCDGIIRQITVRKGNCLCTVGQAVKEGQLIVSGYTDYGLCVVGTAAQAEIYGDTVRDISVIFPSNYMAKQETGEISKKYALIFGKKRINFSQGSGISGGSCDKIYEEKYMCLPGGFTLPIGIVIQTQICYSVESKSVKPSTQMVDYVSRYILQQMISGRITASRHAMLEMEDYFQYEGVYHCFEMIGITRTEERITEHG